MYNVLFSVIAPSIVVAAGMAIGIFAPGTMSYISLITGTTFLYGYVQYFCIYKPALGVKDATRKKIIKCILSELRAELYKKSTPTVRSNFDSSEIRLNVMSFSGGLFWNKFLRMSVCLDGYTNAEIDLKWRLGEGACGLAWKEKKQMISKKNDHTSETLKSGQKEICREVISVLSTPIKPKYRRIQGIINIDSTACTVAQLRLEKENVQDIVQIYADLIAELY